MTLTELVNRARDLTLVISDSFDDASVKAFINEALMYVAAEDDWPWCQDEDTITTVAGTSTYSLPGSAVRLVAVIPDGNAPEPAHVSRLEAHRRFRGTTPATWAQAFTLVGLDKVRLFPEPKESGTEYTVIYQEEPSPLVAGGDTPPFLSAYHHVLSDYAAAQMFTREEMAEEAAVSMGRYELGVARMRRFYHSLDPNRPRSLGSVPRR